MDQQLLPEIECFLSLTGMSPTRFSQDAIRDRHFVRQLRNGRRVWPETAEKARLFMAEHRPEATAA
jgi:hypothetical protein